jgi:hypothetical protein
MSIKKIFGLLFCVFLTGCYFGANESKQQIIKDFYLVSWDERDWIAYSADDKSIYVDEKIVIGHDVFAVGNNDDFIIVKQHPCENKELHFMDYDSLKPNKAITNYYIIDTRTENYKIHRFNNALDFNEGRTRLGIPKSLPYKFYDKLIE